MKVVHLPADYLIAQYVKQSETKNLSKDNARQCRIRFMRKREERNPLTLRISYLSQ
jgi:hypothetical protein